MGLVEVLSPHRAPIWINTLAPWTYHRFVSQNPGKKTIALRVAYGFNSDIAGADNHHVVIGHTFSRGFYENVITLSR